MDVIAGVFCTCTRRASVGKAYDIRLQLPSSIFQAHVHALHVCSVKN